MIYCISGLLGGGKSFYAVEKMAKHIASGGVVYSNIKLELDPWFNTGYKNPIFFLPEEYPGALTVVDDDGTRRHLHDEKGYCYNAKGFRELLRSRFGWQLQDGQYYYLRDDDVGPGLPSLISGGSTDLPVMVVLDEALDHFEAGDNATSKDFRSFLRHVRKLGIDLYFIAQDFGSLDRKIRALCHYTVNCKDFATWRAPVLGVPLPPPFRWNIYVLEWHACDYGKITCPPVNRDKLHYRDPLIFGSYSSTGLHRVFPLKVVRSDFRGVGVIKDKEVPMWCKVLSIVNALALCVLGWLWLHSAPPAAPVYDDTALRDEFAALSSRLDSMPAPVDVAPGADSPPPAVVVGCWNDSVNGGYTVVHSDGKREHSPTPPDM